MNHDLTEPDQALVDLVSAHWAPDVGDADAFLGSLHRRRVRRSRREDVLAGLAAVIAWGLCTGTVEPEPASWLASTSLVEESPVGSAELNVLHAMFLQKQR